MKSESEIVSSQLASGAEPEQRVSIATEALEGLIEDVEVMVEGEGLAEVEIVRVRQGSVVGEIVAAIAAKSGFAVAEGLLFVEDEEEPLDLALVVVKEMSRKVHHVHRARQIEVAVYYKDQREDRRFSPSARVQRVLDWVNGPDGFKIDSAIAPEMELALHGQTAVLPKNAHIGRFVAHPHHAVEFDLVRGVVPNGGPDVRDRSR